MRAWAAGLSRKLTTTLAPARAEALKGMARKWLLVSAPFSMAMAWTVGGRVPFCTELWASPGLKLMAMASSPSSSNCLVSAAPVGKSLPFRQSAG